MVGFCFLGVMGDCAPEATATVKLQNVASNNVIAHALMENLTEHQAGGHFIQRITARSTSGNILIEDVNMKNYVEITLDSWQRLQTDAEMKAVMSNAVDNIVKSSLDAVSGFMSQGSRASFEADLSTTVKNVVNSDVTMRTVNSCLASAYVEQVVDAVSTTGNVTVRGIHMENASFVAAGCITDVIAKVSSESNQVNKVVNDIDSHVKAEARGPLESKGAKKQSKKGAKKMPITIAIVVIVVLVLIFALLFFFMRRKKAKSA